MRKLLSPTTLKHLEISLGRGNPELEAKALNCLYHEGELKPDEPLFYLRKEKADEIIKEPNRYKVKAEKTWQKKTKKWKGLHRSQT